MKLREFESVIELLKSMEQKNNILNTALSEVCDWYPISMFWEDMYKLSQFMFEEFYEEWEDIRDMLSRWLREDVEKFIYKKDWKTVIKDITKVEDLYKYLQKKLQKRKTG